MKSIVFWNRIIAIAGSILCVASVSVLAAEPGLPDIKLTEEQSKLLNGYHHPFQANYDIHTLSAPAGSAVPLVSLQFTAETNLMKGNTLELGANYRSWSVNPESAQLDVTTIETKFSVQAPIQQALDFSKAIREKVELCPEKLIDKVVIDGAVAFNYSW